MGRKESNNKKYKKNKETKVHSFKVKEPRHLRIKKKPWTLQEDELVRQLVQKYGPQKWSFIAKYVPGRQGKQCRQRWHNHLNPTILKVDWREHEQWILFLAHSAMGSRWADMTRMLKGRTDNSIKNHWNSTMQKKLPYFQQVLSDIVQNKRKSYLENIPKPQQYQNLQTELLEMILIQKQNLRKKLSIRSKNSQQNLFPTFSKNQSFCQVERTNTILQNKNMDQQMNSIKTEKNKDKDDENLFIPLRKQNSYTYQQKQNMDSMMLQTPPRVNHRSGTYGKISEDQNKSINEVIPEEQSQDQQYPNLTMMNLLSPSNFLIKMESKRQ